MKGCGANSPTTREMKISRKRRRRQGSCRRRNQDFVAPAASYIPIEVVSVAVRDHQHRERTPSSVVCVAGSDRDAVVIVRQGERIQEILKEAKGRPKGVPELWIQGEDDQTNQPRVHPKDDNWALNQTSWQDKNGCSIRLGNFQGDRQFVEEFFNSELRIKTIRVSIRIDE